MSRCGRTFYLWLFLAASCSQGACATHSVLTGARAVPVDNWQFTVGVSFVPQLEKGDFDVLGLPMLDFAARFGVSEVSDVGVRFNTMGFLSVDAKFELFDNDAATMAIKPSFGLDLIQAVGSNTFIMQFDVPLLVDGHVGKDATITLAGKFSTLFDAHGRHDHYLGWDLAGDVTVQDPYVKLGPFVSMMWRLNNEQQLARAVDLLAAYGFAIRTQDTY